MVEGISSIFSYWSISPRLSTSSSWESISLPFLLFLPFQAHRVCAVSLHFFLLCKGLCTTLFQFPGKVDVKDILSIKCFLFQWLPICHLPSPFLSIFLLFILYDVSIIKLEKIEWRLLFLGKAQVLVWHCKVTFGLFALVHF